MFSNFFCESLKRVYKFCKLGLSQKPDMCQFSFLHLIVFSFVLLVAIRLTSQNIALITMGSILLALSLAPLIINIVLIIKMKPLLGMFMMYNDVPFAHPGCRNFNSLSDSYP